MADVDLARDRSRVGLSVDITVTDSLGVGLNQRLMASLQAPVLVVCQSSMYEPSNTTNEYQIPFIPFTACKIYGANLPDYF